MASVHNNMDESYKHIDEQVKEDTKEYMLCKSLFIQSSNKETVIYDAKNLG